MSSLPTVCKCLDGVDKELMRLGIHTWIEKNNDSIKSLKDELNSGKSDNPSITKKVIKEFELHTNSLEQFVIKIENTPNCRDLKE